MVDRSCVRLHTLSPTARSPRWLTPQSSLHSGALFLSLVIIVVWSRTATACFKLLAGSAAPMEFQNLVVYNAMLFSDSIEKIDSCIVYHSGPNYIVEREYFQHQVEQTQLSVKGDE